VGSDARSGRVYLPRADLRAFAVTEDDLKAGRHTPAFVALMERQAGRAHHFYRRARATFPAVDARSLVAAEVMGRIYFALLREIEARRFQVFGERIGLPARRKAAIALRCWAAARFHLGGGLRPPSSSEGAAAAPSETSPGGGLRAQSARSKPESGAGA
jgi:phytoene synthase